MSFGQKTDSYGNEWIDYSQKYLRIGISENGLYRIPLAYLPEDFRTSKLSDFQLWHRGQEVSIIDATSDGIIFYGEANDGKLDSLVFRPMSSKINPYMSLFSDEGSYFLTMKQGARRSETISASFQGDVETFHYQEDLYRFNKQFAFGTYSAEKSLKNSFYVNGNSWTSATIAGINAIPNSSVKETKSDHVLDIANYIRSSGGKITIEVLVNGLQEGTHKIHISVGKSHSAEDLREVSSFTLEGWSGKSVSFTIDENFVSNEGKCFLRVTSDAQNNLDWFGIGYITVSSPQSIDLQIAGVKRKSGIFNFAPVNAEYSKLIIANASKNFGIINISKPNLPSILTGNETKDGLEIIAPRVRGERLKLFVYDKDTEVKNVAKSSINEVNLLPWYGDNATSTPSLAYSKNYDFLLITTSNLKEAALEYAVYRKSELGGGNRVLVMDIRSIYDQFNFGEPSPAAIRKFVKYMLKDGIRDKHNLLLIGSSITFSAAMTRELKDEVPTFGDPGSDILLVSGMNGLNEDIPSIPVGRIPAINVTQVRNYLEKVKIHEKGVEHAWKKNILHLNGGQSTSEINQLKGILANLVPYVENGSFGGKVISYVKQNPADVESVNISKDVNSGVGMITYFGHGSISKTDLDFGYVTDVNRGYNNSDKYPLMYFNGCGVGNHFFRKSPFSMSADWLLAQGKGAIGVIANSYLSYVTPSVKHLTTVYENLYSVDTELSMGQVIKRVAEKIVLNGANNYDIANIHQANLLGDPSLVLTRASQPDYTLTPGKSIFLHAESPDKTIGSSKKLKLLVVVGNSGKYIKNQEVEIEAKIFYKNGTVENVNGKLTSIAVRDTFTVSVNNNSGINKIEVSVDPKNVILELNKVNNILDFVINWDDAVLYNVYPNGSTEDKVPPRLNVSVGGKFIQDDVRLSSSAVIDFELVDDNPLVSDRDTVFLDVYLKPCLDTECNFVRLSYGRDLHIDPVRNANVIKASFDVTRLTPGVYEMLVNGRDLNGNSLLVGYRIRFRIGDDVNEGIDVTVSPNPATDYIRFVADGKKWAAGGKVEWSIFNLYGVKIDFGQEELGEFKNEWYWIPKVQGGLYYYRLNFYNVNKSIVQKNSGKLILIR
ncbi:C25 family cysteine peptidase [Dyadobacter sp. CY312]|uniref:putative type IX secretion system sortase PorU2 n=1 Tax=Dyadobacter sp. CY312 TaxID=2907303 RepID=UPI001F392E40|nr:C25 family cysteine peptidase [Dyadobacter sp. CY312]MCE7041222.1 C25 family cysteine peptidase [Dyadobacter sp. CY312]